MELSKKVAYLKGLMEGLKIDDSTNEGKILTIMADIVDGDYCFVEDTALKSYERWIEKIIVFRWNRAYPADQSFDLDLCGGNWKLSESDEFAGYSHERITMEVYLR